MTPIDAHTSPGGDVRVCPDCGNKAGAEPFCSSCGLNLSGLKRLPARADWEAEHQPTEPEATEPKASEPERPADAPKKAGSWIRRHRCLAAGGVAALAAALAVLLSGGTG
jgi:hypothetical protein